MCIYIVFVNVNDEEGITRTTNLSTFQSRGFSHFLITMYVYVYLLVTATLDCFSRVPEIRKERDGGPSVSFSKKERQMITQRSSCSCRFFFSYCSLPTFLTLTPTSHTLPASALLCTYTCAGSADRNRNCDFSFNNAKIGSE